ncbi:MAG: UDP-N-acetylenolpyruvoylglucosamine reductase [Candidatus Taylorbacteria bacterium RIFCSPHIGHO2_02_FULL_44_36]|uniref:UDP-N-acetylenolpyruvoylglucosamine reductase n=1 Tax=Candidatus Taylorbacteria bacterium RIFCSPLOWO2_12_FULL_44_15c TaxID=1802333 RepID=A0A1G2P4G4_9BACT|nr:MAG: UDP-N-acetylenolpyruvoylglucosamine reductase [Candidatus Taylorbacteria bacterium RIFCSPHIGHO2_02_FULL_44_36]OHA38158.1 MAG: UDP-N-acetylenolpyruvoylglucosamine reductase [Candidatus Taylorbacteria bacterium RIFCSPLOWO2_02_FULL_44_35]OHA43153.1 MAG: UDP-N-acetylenolpyruvoylglucosamine reductase [Candidatus Taylorbacteria bacterium RIFCSPLOWO2_12_FULL_44_15c]
MLPTKNSNGRKILENVSLKELTTFKVGGRARYFCVAKNLAKVTEAMDFAKKNKLPVFILGCGSNILVSNKGFSGLVVKMDILGVEFVEKAGGKVEIIAGAGENWDDLVRLTVEKNLHGLENLSLIPGSVGAAPVQNIGAYGVEVASVISFVEIFDRKTAEAKILNKEACRFNYRQSIFQTPAGKNFIIVRIGFLLNKSKRKKPFKTDYPDVQEWLKREKISAPTIADIRRGIVEIRTKKLPNLAEVGTAGSFFKNPIISDAQFKKFKVMFPDLPGVAVGKNKVKIFLAWVLDKMCGLKGFSIGKVGLHKNQPLVIVNYGGATAGEIKSFAEKIAIIVKEKTGLAIKREVEYVG